VLDELLPPEVQVAELYEDPPGIGLYAEEQACVTRAVEARRREFATARHCARTALGKLGLVPVAIAKDTRGGPRWPAGVVGSITHCAGYRAAAVARATDLATIGVDAEPAEPLPSGVLDLISIPRERAELTELAARWPGVPWDRLLFSAKESVYKAWAPVMRSFLDFDGADIRINPAVASFAARLLVPGADAVTGPGRELRGRFVVRDGLLATAVVRKSDGR
jgi:4'-phosphopantetheinyl transferase EntD